MQVLRNNKESLMAVLEAFVYDPLINWRLMQTEGEAPRAEDSGIEPVRAAELARAAAHPQGPLRKLRVEENEIFKGMLDDFPHTSGCAIYARSDAHEDRGLRHEVQNERALAVYNRVQHKLTGKLMDDPPMTDQLIAQ